MAFDRDDELAKMQADGLVEADPIRTGFDAPLASEVEQEPIDWLWRGRLARGKLSILDGDPGLGKSTLTIDLVARLSTASPMPDGAPVDGPINVILLSAEDGVADTIVPRLKAAGADLGRVRPIRSHYDEKGRPRPVNLPGDLDDLEDRIADDATQLVVIDPLMAYLGGGADSHKDQDMRVILHALAAMIERQRCAGLVVRHLNKTPGGNPLYRGGGSIGIIGAARVGMIVAPDPADDSRVIFASSKSNLTKRVESLAYRLVGDELYDCGVVKWLGTSTLGADAILNPPRETAVDAAETFLDNLLSGGPVLQSEVKTRARDEGHSWASMRRAKDELGVESVRQNVEGESRGSGAWYWSLTGDLSTLNNPQNPYPVPDSATSKVLIPTVTGDNGEWSLEDREAAEKIKSWNRAVGVGTPMPLDDIPRA